MSRHNDLGAEGEALAASYLETQGYRIRARNFRSGKGEIDIIASDGNTLVFVEVKTRSTARFGLPREAVTPFKQNMLRKTAMSYLVQLSKEIPCRFDVVEIQIHANGTYQLNQLKKAF